jgi:V8-like Glu-specific endopeptidase
MKRASSIWAWLAAQRCRGGRVAIRPPLLLALLGLPVAAPGVVDGIVDANTPDSPWAAVGSLSVRGKTFTATIVAPDLALTAAHVLTGASSEDVVLNVNDNGDLAQRIAVTELIIHPAYRGVIGLRPGGEYDLALVRLATPAGPLATMPGIFEGDVPAGAIITFVGYGAAGNGVQGVTIDGNPAVKRMGHNVADCFAWTLGEENCGIPSLTGLGPRALYVFDFDPPGGSSVLASGEATLAGGDSGSPMFLRIGGGWKLAGVNTFVTLLKGKPQGVYGTAGGGVLITHEHRLWIQAQVRSRPLTSNAAPGEAGERTVRSSAIAMLLVLGGGVVGYAVIALPNRSGGQGRWSRRRETKR